MPELIDGPARTTKDPVFLWVLAVLMLVNGAVLTLLYRPYAQDVARVQGELDRRRSQALGAG
jgi:hypothetical protein